jgi:dTDP-4-dehydrorhamnose reductase
MRWLVVGASGMLGQDLVALLRERGESVRAADRAGSDLTDSLDITDAQACLDAVKDLDVVVNCAAYTAVDEAELHESQAFAVNAAGAGNLARAARHSGVRIVHISTDYVFDGGATAPYAEDDALAPRSAYGRTKGAGEWAVRAECPDHLVVRTAWLYGAGGACFPKTVARIVAERGGIDVINDQVGQPTWTGDLADLIVRLVSARAASGIYHGTSSGEVSWHGFAREIVAAVGLDPQIVRTTTSTEFVLPAPRPAYSVLGHAALMKADVAPIGDWAERWAVASGIVLGARV